MPALKCSLADLQIWKGSDLGAKSTSLKTQNPHQWLGNLGHLVPADDGEAWELD